MALRGLIPILEAWYYILTITTKEYIMLTLKDKLVILRGYLIAQQIDFDCASPNLVADICFNYFPQWNISPEDILYLSNKM